jgi:hypothetical protein
MPVTKVGHPPSLQRRFVVVIGGPEFHLVVS